VDTSTPLKAIETRFDGYRFRSRLEARWAVFFKTLGVRYEYEKEGYDLGAAGWYLPDFWLPEQRYWIEIKGQEASEEEEKKARLVADGTKCPVFLFTGTPEALTRTTDRYGYVIEGSMALGFRPGSSAIGTEVWQECNRCGAIGIAPLSCELPDLGGYKGTPPCDCLFAAGEKASAFDSVRLLAAYEAARSARFEHGARG
jgi:hypothetical protein